PPAGSSKVRYNSDFGAMLLTDNGSSLTLEFWSITGGGTVIDSYTINAANPPSPNEPPVNTVPGAQTVLEDKPLAFSTDNGNQISISDPDAGNASVRVTLTMAGGTATIGTSG